MNEKHTKIDASGQSLGRLATQIAVVLRGKHLPEYEPHKDAGCTVHVENAEQVKFTGKKLRDKIYYRHSGYPGGLKQRTLQEMINKKGYSEVIKKAVWHMLPSNKLRDRMIKRLTVKN